MATTKRRTTRRAKPGSAARATRASARTTGRKKAAVKKATKKAGAKRPSALPTRAGKAAAARAAGKASAGGSAGQAVAAAALTKRLKAQFARERAALEQRLTETVREIGVLRHHEMRATQLARQLAERDATIADLRRQLATPPQAAAAPADTQAGLQLGTGAAAGLNDLDETAALDDEDDDLI